MNIQDIIAEIDGELARLRRVKHCYPTPALRKTGKHAH